METILIMIATAAIFSFGVMIGYKLRNNDKPIELPSVETIATKIPFTKEYKEKQVETKEIRELQQLLNNIDNYNGTPEGQVEFNDR